MRKMNVLRALRWLTAAWAHDLNPDIIKTGFEKAQLFKEDLDDQVPRRRGGRGAEETVISSSEAPISQKKGLEVHSQTSVNATLEQQRHQQHHHSGTQTLSVPVSSQVDSLELTLPSQHSFNLQHQFQGQHQPYHQNIQVARTATDDITNVGNDGSSNSNGDEVSQSRSNDTGDAGDGRVVSLGTDPRSDLDRYLTLAELIKDVQQLASRFASDQSMPFKLFLNPEEEEVVDCNDDILEQIASQFIGDRDAETDEENEPVRKVTWKEALDGLEALMQFEEQQPNGQIDVINVLYKHKRLIELRKT